MPRILVVDDEPGIRALLAAAFTRAGYEVRTANSARQAISLCSAEAFDALLSDVRMPQMDGHDLVQWVTAVHPTVRCVLMSAFDDRDCDDCPFQLRCHFLPKPFTPKQAVSFIDNILKETPRRLQ